MHKTFNQLDILGSGLKCQVCGGGSGVCSSDADNGESEDCMTGLNACWYIHDSKGFNFEDEFLKTYLEYFLSYRWSRGYHSNVWSEIARDMLYSRF